jgi:hypothetical protein
MDDQTERLQADRTNIERLASAFCEALVTISAPQPGREQRDLAAELHRSLVAMDDLLCKKYDFSRQPRGRYDRRQAK